MYYSLSSLPSLSFMKTVSFGVLFSTFDHAPPRLVKIVAASQLITVDSDTDVNGTGLKLLTLTTEQLSSVAYVLGIVNEAVFDRPIIGP